MAGKRYRFDAMHANCDRTSSARMSWRSRIATTSARSRVSTLDLGERLRDEVVVPVRHAADASDDGAAIFPPGSHRNEEFGRRQFHVQPQPFLERRNGAQQCIRFRAHHQIDVDRRLAPADEHRTGSVDQEDIGVGRGISRQCRHERPDAFPIGDIAHCSARR